jgi:hypothetical protein
MDRLLSFLKYQRQGSEWRSEIMMLNVLRFASLLLTAVSMAGGFAHLFELPKKINLPREDYLMVQQIYRMWALLGIAVVGALVSTATLAFYVRHTPANFYLTFAAALCMKRNQTEACQGDKPALNTEIYEKGPENSD